MDRRLWTIIGAFVILVTVRVADGQALGDDCSVVTTACDGIQNAECDTFTCVCSTGYKDDGTGTSCIANALGDDCSVVTTACDGIQNAECDTSTCVCSAGYKDDGTGISCIDNELGDSCSGNAECSGVLNAVCEGGPAGVCACDTGYVDNAGACDAIECPTLTTPADGAVDMTGGVNFGNQAIFSCNAGYDPDGPVTATCQVDGSWDVPSHTCTIKDCGSPNQPSFGTVALDSGSSTYSSTATFTCNIGFSPDDPVITTCQADGNWDITVQTCTIKDCGGLSNPTNGGVDTSGGTTYGEMASFSCDPGYLPLTPVTATCQADGTWDVTTHLCTARDCGDPTPTDGTYTGSTTYPNSVTIECDPGYDLSGSSTISCETSGLWSETPTCNAKDCGDPTPTNGAASGTYTYPNTATVSCNTGYNIQGSPSITCLDNGNWSASPTCNPVACPSLSDPSNGLVSHPLITYLEVATYSCNLGYNLVGDTTRTCQADTTWSGNEPTCQIQVCPGLTSPANGQVDGFTIQGVYEDMATYSCDIGHNLNGATTTQCQADGTWSQPAPSCDIVDCGDPPDPADGSVSTTAGTTYDESAAYTCNVGYDLTGISSRTCQANGQWNGAAPTCVIVNCLQPSAPGNGRVDYTAGTTYGNVATYGCHTGYDLIGDTDTTCQADATWSIYTTASCIVKDCQNLPNPANGIAVTTDGTIFGKVGQYSCISGYIPLGETTTTCQGDGTWSPEDPFCTIQYCGSTSVLENGGVDISQGSEYANIATYYCNAGYDLTGDITTICLSDATWSQDVPPFCRIRDCHTLPNPTNGIALTPNGTRFGAVGQYSCNSGYRQTGDTTTTCQADATWSPADPMCTIKYCGVPTSPANGGVDIPQGTKYGDIATYFCNGGYDITGDATTTCQSDATWSEIVQPSCRIRDCHSLPNPSNGIAVTPNGTTFGETGLYSCNSGYLQLGDTTSTCLADGTWSQEVPLCKIQECGLPSPPTNGGVDVEGTKFTDIATYYCIAGYDVTGDTTSICLNNASWSEIVAPFCLIRSCPSLSNPTNGLVSAPLITYQEMATYSCNTGYNLVGDTTRTCQADKTWSGNEATCQIQDCLTLPNPSSGHVETNLGTTYTQHAHYLCNVGYVLNGVPIRTCLATGSWDGVASTCILADCGFLNSPFAGSVSTPTGTTYNQPAMYTCNIGYKLIGATLRLCQNDEIWSGSDPICELLDCGFLPSPVSGFVSTADDTTYGKTAIYSCLIGFGLDGISTRTCQADGQWSGEAPTCVILNCPALLMPSHGTVSSVTGVYEDVVTYACNEGYDIVGVTTRICQVDASWSDSHPTCDPRDCAPPVAPVNGRVDYSTMGTTYGAVAIYNCITGYGITGDSTTTCQADGTWSVEETTYCFVRDCQNLPNPSNGIALAPNGTTYGQVGQYSCNTGYMHLGATTTTCMADGNWRTEDALCQIRDCGFPSPPANGRVDISNGTKFKDVATYYCNSGYDLSGDSTTICLSDAKWSDLSPPACNIRDCETLWPPANGYVSEPVITADGQIATYTCYVGYILIGDATRTCESIGWSGSSPICSSGCLTPKPPTNGGVNITDGTAAGATVYYYCDGGYSLVGDNSRICHGGTTWNVPEPICAVVCPELTEIRHGTLDMSLGNLEGSVATFICDGDYALVGSATRTCMDPGIWSGTDPECIFVVFPDLLAVFTALCVLLLVIDVFIVAFWMFLKYRKHKKKDDPEDDETEEAQNQSIKKPLNSKVSPSPDAKPPVNFAHNLSPIPPLPFINKSGNKAPESDAQTDEAGDDSQYQTATSITDEEQISMNQSANPGVHAHKRKGFPGRMHVPGRTSGLEDISTTDVKVSEA